jgi:hypothetical protein
MAHRHLAGTETVDANLVLGVNQALVQTGLHVGSRDNDLEFALQPFSERFNNLHFLKPSHHGGGAQTAVGLLSSTAPETSFPGRGFPYFFTQAPAGHHFTCTGEKDQRGEKNPEAPRIL